MFSKYAVVERINVAMVESLGKRNDGSALVSWFLMNYCELLVLGNVNPAKTTLFVRNHLVVRDHLIVRS